MTILKPGTWKDGQKRQSKMKPFKVFFWLCLFSIVASATVRADTIYLKNGKRIEGRVLRDNGDRVEFLRGHGFTVWINHSDIKEIEKSSAVQLDFDMKSPNHVFADCLINETAKVKLLVDTGASVILIPQKTADQLGIKMDNPRNIVQCNVADGRTVKAYLTRLKTVQVKDLVAHDVEATVLMDDSVVDKNFDGLLGMSFLGRFNTKIDYAAKKFTIET